MTEAGLPFDLSPTELLRHERWMRGLIRSLVRGPAADDVVQDTWLAALRSPPAGVASLRAWLARVARTFALRERRSEARRRKREATAVAAAAAERAAEPSAAETVERLAGLRAAASAVLDLPEPYRTTILLRYLHELSPATIAERTGTQAATVRKRVERGLELMRERLHEREGEDWRVGLAALAAGPQAWAWSALGGAFAMKKTVAAAAAILVLAMASTWWLAPDRGGPDQPARSSATPATVPLAASRDSAPLREPLAAPPADPAPTPPTVPALGSLVVRLVWGDDQKPAAGVGVNVHEFARQQRYESPLVLTTDAAGEARFAQVLAGEVLVVPELGSRRRAIVAPATEVPVDLVVERGYDVAGVVVDGQGLPVAGAEVLLSDALSSIRGRVAAVADARGEFLLRSVGGQRSVWAQSTRSAPSQHLPVRGASGARVVVRLVLGGTAGAIEGTVIDANAKPVAGATVRVGDHALAYKPATATDAAGAFAFAGLAPGKTKLEVLAPGCLPVERGVEVLAGQPARVEVRVEAGGSVRGTVRTSDNKPVPGALVCAWRSPPAKGPTATVMAWTGADGSYEILGVASGPIDVAVDTDGFGKADTKLVMAPNGSAQWNPVLDAGLVLSGRLVDDQGRPVASGWHVALSKQASSEGSARELVEPAADGTFRLVNVPDEELRLHASPVESLGFYRPALLDHLRPGANVELRIPGGMPSVRITGVVLDAQGAPCKTAVVQPDEPTCKSSGTFVASVDAATGRFALGPYPPGKWTLRVFARPTSTSPSRFGKAKPDLVLGPRTLGPSETWDLGTFRLP